MAPLSLPGSQNIIRLVLVLLETEQLVTGSGFPEKQIIIQKALTQGLDPNVSMKNSGVDWIGQVPDHWELIPLKRLAKLSPSVSVKNKRSSDLACFLAMEKVSIEGDIESDIMLPIKEISQGFTPFNRGDVIVAKITPCFENGKSAYLKGLPSRLRLDISNGGKAFPLLQPRML